VRNGADVWLRGILDQAGFSQYFFLPAVTVGLLLAWHHATREKWQLSVGVLYGMFVECALLAGLLLAVGRGMAWAAHSSPWDAMLPAEATASVGLLVSGRGAVVGRMLGFVGAGIYEEVLFRLLLVPPLASCVVRLGAARSLGIVLAVICTSVVFAGAHYVGPAGEAWNTLSFAFRFIAGAVFALLFVYRGFGIAAGTHALYDILVSLR